MGTDTLGSSAAATAESVPGLDHRQHQGLNTRGEASHRHTGRREKIRGRFTSPRQAQHFLSTQDQTASMFCPKRHRQSARSYRHARSDAFTLWTGYTAELTT
jgi:putative transposase